jgi:hypothetical protein
MAKHWLRRLRGLLGTPGQPRSVHVTGSLGGPDTGVMVRCPVCLEPLPTLPTAHRYKIGKDARYCWTP